MTPYEQAAALYESGEVDSTLAADMEAHGLHGYILSTPTCFLLARAVPKSQAPYDISAVYPLEECDTWLVWAMAGDIREAMAFAPPTMKWIAFARKGVLRFHRFQNVKRKLLGHE